MKDTIMVQRANVILDISPEQKDYYKSQGFAVISEDGSIVEESTSLSIDSLNRKVQQLQSIIDQKDAEIARLRNNGGRGRKNKDE